MKKIFISYSHEDAPFKDLLVKQLGILKLAGLSDPWEDSRIECGKEWKGEIEKAVKESDVAILLVSEGFLTPYLLMRPKFRLSLSER